MRKNKLFKFTQIHPFITFIILSAVVIVFSFIFASFNAQDTYNLYLESSSDYSPVTESVTSMLSLSGIKYIFTNSVSNFANFTVLVNLILVLIGIGIMDKSGFMQTTVTLLTKKAKKNTVTFTIILLCLFASIIGDLSYIIFIPLTAIFFYYGKRNPFIGIIASFGALTTGSGLSMLFTSTDSILKSTTILNSSVLQTGYNYSIFGLLAINLVTIVITAFVLTWVTENIVAKKMPKYEFSESALEEDIVTKKEKRGMFFALASAIFYLLIIIYNIIPNLPFSGNLLDYSQTLYIDKLFSYESFFTNGFVFIVTMLFIILGLMYGIFSGSFKKNSDIVEGLGHSLDGIGKTLLLIFVAATFISIFKETNIGNTIVVFLANTIESFNFTGIPLVILLFVVSIISTIFVPSSVIKWPIIASTAVPAFMNAGLTPEFAQVVFRFGESVSMGLTPLLAYFIVYLAYIEKYDQSGKTISIWKSIKFQFPYAIAMFIIVLLVILFFYITNIPLGFGGSVAL